MTELGQTATPRFVHDTNGLNVFKGDHAAIRHCKIVGTLGPASSNEKTLR